MRDLVVCLTRYLLAFEENGQTYYDYLSLPSDDDNAFKFITTYGLYENAKKAGCSFEKSVVYHILTQLLIHFADNLGFHPEVRSCIFDFCEEHSWMIKGMKRMRLCRSCSKEVENKELKKLRWLYLPIRLKSSEGF
jgi:predicted metal-binding protein